MPFDASPTLPGSVANYITLMDGLRQPIGLLPIIPLVVDFVWAGVWPPVNGQQIPVSYGYFEVPAGRYPGAGGRCRASSIWIAFSRIAFKSAIQGAPHLNYRLNYPLGWDGQLSANFSDVFQRHSCVTMDS